MSKDIVSEVEQEGHDGLNKYLHSKDEKLGTMKTPRRKRTGYHQARN